MSREDGLARLEALARRMGLTKQGAIKVRRAAQGSRAMSLSFEHGGVRIEKTCSSQPSADKNLACLVLWLSDLVRNIERRIETFEEAFFNEGAASLMRTSQSYEGFAENLYRGEATRDESLARIERALGRLGLTRSDVRVTWGERGDEARLRVRLRSGRVVEKVSTMQRSLDANLAVLALWLQNRAKNYERGLATDIDQLFASNLLPP